METLFESLLTNFSRRDFLKLAGTSLFSLFMLPITGSFSKLKFGDEIIQDLPHLGRIINNNALVYDRPSFSGKILNVYICDLVFPITKITIGDDQPSYNRIWYEINGKGFVHSGNVQPVDIQLNPIEQSFPVTGRLAEVTVPYTDSFWSFEKADIVAYRLYYGTTYWITGLVKDSKGNPWYQFPDDKWGFNYYVNPAHLHIIKNEELAPISPSVSPADKHIEVHLDKQVVIAYEMDRPVFMTRTATGAKFSDGNFTTPSGYYLTNRKRPSRHMAAGDPAAPTSYDLPGIPWVNYITKKGISFHGTYWHNDFGKPRSHGCINLSIPAAKWVYRWTMPVVPFDKDFWSEDIGTSIKVI